MAVFMKFEGSNASRCSNSLHAAYHKAVLNVLKETGEDNLELMHVSRELQEEYAMTVTDLVERTMEAQASVDTQSTMAYDVEHDRLLSVLFFLEVSGVLSSVAEEQSAAKKLDVILRVYKGIQGKVDDSEIQLIDALLIDLKKSENAEALTALRLDEIITQLNGKQQIPRGERGSYQTAEYETFAGKDPGVAFIGGCSVGSNPGFYPSYGHCGFCDA